MPLSSTDRLAIVKLSVVGTEPDLSSHLGIRRTRRNLDGRVGGTNWPALAHATATRTRAAQTLESSIVQSSQLVTAVTT